MRRRRLPGAGQRVLLKYVGGGGGPRRPRNPAPSPHDVAEHQGRVPQPGVPTGPRQTVPAAPSSPAAGKPVYNPDTGHYVSPTTGTRTTPPSSPVTVLDELNDLLTPGPTARETAEKAHRLGYKPKSAGPEGLIPGGIEGVVDAFGKSFQSGLSKVVDDIGAVGTLKNRHVSSVLGRKTLGEPTIGRIVQAANKDKVRINQRGEITLPAERRAARKLRRTRHAIAATGPDVQALHQQYPELSPRWIRAIQNAQRKTGTPAALLAGILSQESDFGRSNLPGVHSGQNYAGAAGPFQIGNGTGASGNAWEQVSRELWGADAPKHSIYNPEDAALAAGHYLQVFPSQPATKDPRTWYNAALSYNHAGWYANDVVREAMARHGLSQVGPAATPQQLNELAAATAKAKQLHLPTSQPDVTPSGHPDVVFVRADAKGFVQWARALLGTQEGSRLQLKWAAQAGISAADPWCAAFITAGILRRGLTPPPEPAASQSWMTWKEGTNIGTDISKAKPGDIIVIGNGDHIGLYVGSGKMIAGNWSDEVSEYPVAEDKRGIEGIIRPNFKGGKVAVHSSQSLPGAAIGPSGEILPGPAGAAGEGAVTGEAPQQQAPISAPISVPVSPLLAAGAPLPAAFQQYELGAAPEQQLQPGELDIIEEILAKRKL